MRVSVVLGTRPEAIKLAPVIRAFGEQPGCECMVVSTGQHREMLDPMLAAFGIEPDVELAAMRPRQSLSGLTALLVESLGETFREEQPDAVLVQGDTTSAFCGALAAFYESIPVGHVEAGLRTGDLRSPFPEEANRRLVGTLARWHFCPTPASRRNLLAEGVPAQRIFVTGNTVIDALLWARGRAGGQVPLKTRPRRILLTLHRRENQGETMRGLAMAIRDLAARGDVDVVFPVHLNPAVREVVMPLLSEVEGVHLCEPLGYFAFVDALDSADLVLTDSGGLQEEAPSLGKPVLVLRGTTERPEAVSAGVARLVGTDRGAVYRAACELLDSPDIYRAMACAANPFGDGHAAERIVAELAGLVPAVGPLAVSAEPIESVLEAQRSDITTRDTASGRRESLLPAAG
jgi:UDP-N-acetylglucosamine 2-epimerase (non-hydrolysing)